MKKTFIQFATTAATAVLLLFAVQSIAQTEGTGVIIRVSVDGVPTDYYNGYCGYGTANWGGAVTGEICATPKWGHSITASDTLGCDSIPAGSLTGNIGLIRRGTCGFSIKALNAQKAGAVAVFIAQLQNTTTDDCFVQAMGATQPQAGETTVPVFFICRNMANQIDAAIAAGKTLEICLVNPDIDIASFFFPVSNVQTPVSQIGVDTFGFSATVSNPSATTARTNIEVKAVVRDGAGAQLYSTSLVVPELAPGVVDSQIILPGLYAPELPLGSYSIQYTTKADQVGADAPIEDRGGSDFYVTQNLFAKEDGATIGFRPGTAGDWATGTMYTLTAGTLDNYEVKNVAFTFTTNAADLPVGDVVSTFYLFKVNDDVAADWSNFDATTLLSPSLEWQGFAVYEAPDNLTGFTMQNIELLDFNTNTLGVKLVPGARYILLCEYNGTSNLAFHAFSQKVVLPPGLVGTVVFRETWFLAGFTGSPNAVLRMYIDLVSTTDEQALPESVLQILPNPVRESLNLGINFDQPTDATITIAEMSGRVIKVEDRQGLTKEMLNYPLQLSAGTYLARIATKDGTRTKKFVVVK